MTDALIDIGSARILVVDDLPANLDVLIAAVEGAGFTVLVATSGADALAVARRESPDIILLDVAMPGMDGFEVCRQLKADGATTNIPVIFLTAEHESERIVAGLGLGAVDYILKPFRKDEVMARLRTHLERTFLIRALAEKNIRLEEEIAQRRRLDRRLSNIAAQEEERWGVAGFVAESPMMGGILRDVGLMQNADRVSVLITGESGTGKELIARAIHSGSGRASAPFVAVNCSTIPHELAESLLFGHRAGSFTGAQQDQTGYFEMADGGTLFLDEIGTMPPAIQPKLLRVLEDGLIRPLGARQDRHVDVRILAATNAPRSAFREDLYFRLARYTVEVPPLRERRDDIPLLAGHFLKLFAVEMGIAPPAFSAAAVEHLSGYDFPGNVRELKNIVERALIESGGGEIGAAHLRLGGQEFNAAVPVEAGVTIDELPLNFAEAEAMLIERAITRAGGNISKAARLLGIDRNKIYRKLPPT